MNSGKMSIHMPDSVPPNVATAFEVLFPSITVAGVFGIFGFVFQKVTEMNISDGIYKVLQIPLEAIMQHPAGRPIVPSFLADRDSWGAGDRDCQRSDWSSGDCYQFRSA
jgi:cellobiose-specific phosphotransferase system component IIC